MVDYLITCLGNYRTPMEYKGKGFDGGRPVQYAVLRILELSEVAQ